MLISNAKATGKKLLPPTLLRLVKSVLPTKTSTKTSSREQAPEYYDEGFILSQNSHKHYTESNHYSLWTLLVDRITRAKAESLLDIGCGSGQLALFLRDKGLSRYVGIDFSTKKIEWAKTICPEFDFIAADAFKTDLFHSHDYDTVVSTEFLEHVEQDLDLIEKIRPGIHFYGTVPNFPGRSHVRHFTCTQKVYDRYGKYFQAFSVDEVLGVKFISRDHKFYLMEGIKI